MAGVHATGRCRRYRRGEVRGVASGENTSVKSSRSTRREKTPEKKRLNNMREPRRRKQKTTLTFVFDGAVHARKALAVETCSAAACSAASRLGKRAKGVGSLSRRLCKQPNPNAKFSNYMVSVVGKTRTLTIGMPHLSGDGPQQGAQRHRLLVCSLLVPESSQRAIPA